MTARRTSLRGVKRDPLIILVQEKRPYVHEDLVALNLQMIQLAMKFSRNSVPFSITPRLDADALTVSVRVRDKQEQILRTYAFNVDCCRRRMSATGDVKLMMWPDALRDLLEFLREDLRKRKKELEARAKAYGFIVDGMALVTE